MGLSDWSTCGLFSNVYQKFALLLALLGEYIVDWAVVRLFVRYNYMVFWDD